MKPFFKILGTAGAFVGGALLLIVSLPIVLIVGLVCVAIGGPMALAEQIMKTIRRDPRPKFEKTSYTQTESEAEYQAILNSAIDFIAQKVPSVKVVSSKKREVKSETDDFSIANAAFSTILTTKNPGSLEVSVGLRYEATKEANEDDFTIGCCGSDNDDAETYNNIEITSPVKSKKPISLYNGHASSRWIAVAALRGDVKVNKYDQVWFYLKEFDCWVIPYKGDWVIGYRKQFKDERVGRYSLR